MGKSIFKRTQTLCAGFGGKFLAVNLLLAAGCGGDERLSDPGPIEASRHEIADVLHTDVERQSIGNCWLYAQATWLESMTWAARRATSGEDATPLDVSQSYWTYWHWFDQVTGYMWKDEIQTGGGQYKSNAIVLDRGVMLETDFVPEDAENEMSYRQSAALAAINLALKSGELKTQEARSDGKLVRRVFDEAWGLAPEVRAELTKVFGEDGEGTLRRGANVADTKILDPAKVAVRFTALEDGVTVVKDTNLVAAIRAWKEVYYPYEAGERREFLQSVQRALHDAQPVVITWDVDFNALENGTNERRGSFNLTTLLEAGRPGRQGGHMTVLEDYEAETEEFGILKAGTTLDGKDPDDARKLEAALLPATKIRALRIKNSWGASRADRSFVPDFPGYHDLAMDYLDGPIKFCPDNEAPTNENCDGESNPLNAVMLPPGY